MTEEIARWRKKDKTGSHTFKFNGKRLRVVSGDFVECSERALGNQVKHYDRLTPKSQMPAEKEQPELQKKDLTLVRVGRKYNVINPDNPDKPLNDEPLRKQAAEQLIGRKIAENETASLDWNALVALMTERGIEIKAEYETEDDLRQALIENYVS